MPMDFGGTPKVSTRKSAKYSARKLGILGVSLLATTLLILGAWAFAHRTKWPDPTLVKAAHSASFPIYYPATLPAGFKYDKNSARDSANVFIYTLSYSGNKKLFISTIPKPDGVQFDDFYTRILSNEQDILSGQGKAVMGNADGQTIGSLVTDKSWVTMNTSTGINSDTLKAIISSLTKL